MPTLSRKKVVLSGLLLAWGNQLRLSADSEASSDGESSDEDVDMSYSLLYFVLESQRYITRRQRVDRPPSRINYYLTRIPDDEFRLHFRMPRLYFHAVCRAIANSPELQSVSERIKQVSELPNCIGLIDGTLFPLFQRPEDHGEDFFSRKSSYAINGLIVCDDRERIRYENIGWPGSSHDNRVWRNCRLVQQKCDHFADNEYLLGDAAYQPSDVFIPAFKKCRGVHLSLMENTFNIQLTKIQIRVEHCIGTLKGRFPLLKRLRARLRNVDELKSTISLIRAAIILHNLTINDKLPDGWVDCEEEEDIEPEELPSGANECRRTYLRDYIFDSIH